MTEITNINSRTIYPQTSRSDIGVAITKIDEMPAMIWYPAKNGTDGSNSGEAFDYFGLGRGKSKAVLDAPLENGSGPHKVVIASHGIGMCAPDLWRIAEGLASSGYIVIAPDHKDASLCHIWGGSDITTREFYRASARGMFDLGKTVKLLLPQQVAMVTENISFRADETYRTIEKSIGWNTDPGSFLYGSMDTNKIGLLGHSLGGWDAFYTAGAGMHCESVSKEECDAGPPPDFNTNDYFRYVCCNDSFFGKTTFGKHEKVGAVAAFGPGMMYYPTPLGLEDIKDTPSMIIAETLPPMVDHSVNIAIPYLMLGRPKYKIDLWSNHMTVSSSIDAIPFARPLLPGYLWHNRAVETYSAWTGAFFDSALSGDFSRINELLARPNCVVREKSWEN